MCVKGQERAERPDIDSLGFFLEALKSLPERPRTTSFTHSPAATHSIMDFRAPLPSAPLPGTQPPTRGLFIDRWNTLFRGPNGKPCSKFEELEFCEGAIDALFRVQQAGWYLYLIGNEDSVAFGKQSLSSWEKLQEAFVEHLASLGVNIQRSYACVDHPQGKGAHARDSVFQLPNTGAFYHAAQHDGVQLRECWVIGDGCLELAAGWRAGCHVARVLSPMSGSGPPETLEVDAEKSAHSLAEILAEISAANAFLSS